ncbi:MAG: hypothetical protein P1Q69_18225 [Candidatus Thorarchaeota archaeon]|nr:hypothetical protein [Candidatus Thorarchaeota archaeon]
MLTLYLLGTAAIFFLALYVYSGIIERRGRGRSTGRKDELSHNMWAAMSLDCDYEPTKHAFGPGRSVNPNERKPIR